MLFLLLLKMGAAVLKHICSSVEQNTKLLNLFLVRPVEGLFEVAVSNNLDKSLMQMPCS